MLAGQLLVAAPTLRDPNFLRVVVLLLDHGEEGALGVVLNRPSDTAVFEVLPAWDSLISHPRVVHAGGPVQPQAAIALARRRPAVVPAGFAPLQDGLGTVDLDGDPDRIEPAIESMRVFAGYAGWGAGQLEGEIGEGAWYVVPAAPDDAFAAEPHLLWRTVLRRQPGQLRLISTMPLDPSEN